MTTTNFPTFVKTWTPRINSYLKEHLASEIDTLQLSKIMAYSVMAGGKRLRPLLFLATRQALNLPLDEAALRAACGIEFIHTYSLIHDDLPEMDNSDLRRGQLTSHKKWGTAQAVLAGDGLLPLGLEWIATGTQSAKAIAIMTDAIGPNGMVGGQYLDIDATNNQETANDRDLIERMEWRKTGCLLLACVEMPLAEVKIEPALQADLLTFARSFGRAYQIYDDLVDVLETSQEAGKETQLDEADGKNNTLTQLGVAASRKRINQLIQQGQASLHGDYPVLSGFFEILKRVLA
ncbi:MAG: polyprenyl synthetase family protein [Lactobacillus sp.]|jgi:geranylgeranyl diphosphate synthase type II|nr:polyprenyl synthetase family protein [Lactobacillus sp.]